MSDALRRIAEDLWVADRPLRVAGIPVGTRMSVIRLRDGGLFLHSPVRADAATREALDALGPVRFVVAPSKIHHFFVGEYAAHYPQARICGAPGLAEKRRDVRFHEILGDAAPAAWAAQLEQVLFGGVPSVNEIVFLHRASRTLLLTDLAFHFREPPASLPLRFFLRLTGTHGRFAATRTFRLLMRDRRAARAALERILALDFERVIVTHGEILERGGREALRRAWSWL